MRRLHATLASLVVLAVAATPALVGGPASAATGHTAAAVAPCLTDLVAPSARTAASEDVPHWRGHSDHPKVTRADLAALPPVETTRRFHLRQVEPRLASRIWIPVYVHVIRGTHKGENLPAGPRKVKRLLRILNLGMAGDQSGRVVNTRYRFKLRKIDYTKRDGWHHAYFNGPRDQRAKKALHRGGAGTLNLYINGGGPKGYPVLGWSRFPWQYRGNPKLDGVSVNMASLPGGRASGYNRGDTVIHETGHWMGLFHTFQGGCGTQGDLVADTAAEDEPSYYCETRRDTCPAEAGLDPVRNFMDYSLDSCMNHFTLGQAQRMDSAFEKWRS